MPNNNAENNFHENIIKLIDNCFQHPPKDQQINAMIESLKEELKKEKIFDFDDEKRELAYRILNQEIKLVNTLYENHKNHNEMKKIFNVVIKSLSNIFSGTKFGIIIEAIKELFEISNKIPKLLRSSKNEK